MKKYVKYIIYIRMSDEFDFFTNDYLVLSFPLPLHLLSPSSAPSPDPSLARSPPLNKSAFGRESAGTAKSSWPRPSRSVEIRTRLPRRKTKITPHWPSTPVYCARMLAPIPPSPSLRFRPLVFSFACFPLVAPCSRASKCQSRAKSCRIQGEVYHEVC